MVMVQQQIEMVEASLQRLSGRLEDVPVNEVLLTRIILFLAHDLSQLMDHHIRPYGLGEGEFRVLTALVLAARKHCASDRSVRAFLAEPREYVTDL
jgi:hypothetical protein